MTWTDFWILYFSIMLIVWPMIVLSFRVGKVSKEQSTGAYGICILFWPCCVIAYWIVYLSDMKLEDI